MREKNNNKKNWKPRAMVSFNTGTRVEKPKRGKGSYSRKRKHTLALH
jgi:stalled ribosome alternative rescue factor ArfA